MTEQFVLNGILPSAACELASVVYVPNYPVEYFANVNDLEYTNRIDRWFKGKIPPTMVQVDAFLFMILHEQEAYGILNLAARCIVELDRQRNVSRPFRIVAALNRKPTMVSTRVPISNTETCFCDWANTLARSEFALRYTAFRSIFTMEQMFDFSLLEPRSEADFLTSTMNPGIPASYVRTEQGHELVGLAKLLHISNHRQFVCHVASVLAGVSAKNGLSESASKNAVTKSFSVDRLGTYRQTDAESRDFEQRVLNPLLNRSNLGTAAQYTGAWQCYTLMCVDSWFTPSGEFSMHHPFAHLIRKWYEGDNFLHRPISNITILAVTTNDKKCMEFERDSVSAVPNMPVKVIKAPKTHFDMAEEPQYNAQCIAHFKIRDLKFKTADDLFNYLGAYVFAVLIDDTILECPSLQNAPGVTYKQMKDAEVRRVKKLLPEHERDHVNVTDHVFNMNTSKMIDALCSEFAAAVHSDPSKLQDPSMLQARVLSTLGYPKLDNMWNAYYNAVKDLDISDPRHITRAVKPTTVLAGLVFGVGGMIVYNISCSVPAVAAPPTPIEKWRESIELPSFGWDRLVICMMKLVNGIPVPFLDNRQSIQEIAETNPQLLRDIKPRGVALYQLMQYIAMLVSRPVHDVVSTLIVTKQMMEEDTARHETNIMEFCNLAGQVQAYDLMGLEDNTM